MSNYFFISEKDKSRKLIVLPLKGQKLDYDPKMTESLQAPDGLHMSVGWLKDDTSCQRPCQSPLSGDAELRLKRRMEIGYGFYLHNSSHYRIRRP